MTPKELIDKITLAAGTILTLVIHKDGIKYLKVDTLIDARKLKRAPADPGTW